jgi:hypothetical protein
MRPVTIIMALVASSCAGADLRSASVEDTEAAYREFLAHHAEGEEADDARVRLEELAFERARRGDDIAAYNRFLSEFPEGDLAGEAEERRAELRLERALEAGDADTLARFLASDGGSHAAARARERLEQVEAATARTSDDPERLRAYLLAHPEGEARREIERRLDDAEFATAAAAATPEALRRYLDAHEHGVHRAEAIEAIERLEADRVVASGDADEMERFLAASPGSVDEARVRRAAAERLAARAEVLLDASLARRSLELDPDGPSASRAEALLAAIRRPGTRLARIQRHLLDLAGPLEVRGPVELRDALRADAPADRWNAVREAALSTDPDAIDVAVEAAGSGDPMLLFLARAALREWAAARPRLAGPPLRRHAERLRPLGANPEDLLRLGAVHEALGEPEPARRAYRAGAGSRETALAGAVHWALLSAEAAPRAAQDEALEAALEAARARLEELVDLVPEQIDAGQGVSALQVLGGLDALGTICQAIVDAYRAPAVDVDALAPGPRPVFDELRRIANAAGATRRRLHARIARDAADLLEGSGDLLADRATERRRRRVEAAGALGELRAVEAVATLVEVAASDDDEVSRAALRAIGRIGSASARAGLLEIARRDPLSSAHAHELAQALRAAAATAPAADRQALETAAAELPGRIRGPEPGTAPRGAGQDQAE